MKLGAKKLFPFLIPSFLISCNIFLFGPFVLFHGNINEFTIPLHSILKILLLPALILVLVFSLVGILLPKKSLQYYISILFILGFLTWLQGNFLVWKYGVLAGREIDWAKTTWCGWVDSSIWCVFLILALVYSGKIFKAAVKGSFILLSIQIIAVILMSIKTPEVWKSEEKLSPHEPPAKAIFELSTAHNVIHFLFDSFQSDIFREIINQDWEHYTSAFEGFTFFEEATGSFPSTHMSIPAIFSGQNYTNNIPIPFFLTSVMNTGKTITNVLYSKGYDIDLSGVNVSYKRGQYTNFYSIPVPYGVTKADYEIANSALMADLSLFRHAPHFLKKFIYNRQLWSVQQLASSNHIEQRLHHYFSHTAFLHDVIENIHVKRIQPVYKFFHLMTTHAPFVLNKNCEYAGKILPGSRENTKIQARCSLDLLVNYLDQLRLIDSYDSSLIIIQADTGAGREIKLKNFDKPQKREHSAINEEDLLKIAGYALPLLMIKPPHSRGSLRISEAQVMLTDIPATINSVLMLNEKFPGRNIFEIDPQEARERKFYYYKWQHENWQDPYFKYLIEFTLEGSAFDIDSWRIGPTHYSPKKVSYHAEKIDFGTEKAKKFMRFGWSENEINDEGVTFNWAVGNSASLHLSLPRANATVLTANIQSLPFGNPQIVTIKVDSKEVGTWELTPPWTLEEHSVVIPANENRPDVSVVEFIFSQYRKPERDSRTMAVAFESITLNDQVPPLPP